MARSSTRASRAADAYSAARSHPYVQRLIDDEALRDNLRDAYEAARHAYGRITKNGQPAKRLMDDKKVQRDLRTAADSLREASEQLRGRRRRKGRLGRVILLGAVGAGVALAFSEGARKAVMDALFGAEEEFEYTSTTGGNGAGADE
jgi:hypothetical protein